MFPPSFDIVAYRKHNNDLGHLDGAQLIAHYNECGKKEGRICSNVYNRETLAEVLDTNVMRCLEIGPFDCPVIRGKLVKYIDVIDQAGLRERSAIHSRPHPIENIPFIDYVTPSGDLTIIKDTFDIVLSCHSIEHQLNFIQHLRDVSKLLSSDGRYVIILPDKRYCFDHFITESSIADVIGQHVRDDKLHSLSSVIEHRALTCHNDSRRHWDGDHGDRTINPEVIKHAIHEHEMSVKNNEYADVHSLQFTPDSFQEIIYLLVKTNFIDLTVDRIYPTLNGSCEFTVILKKKAHD